MGKARMVLFALAFAAGAGCTNKETPKNKGEIIAYSVDGRRCEGKPAQCAEVLTTRAEVPKAGQIIAYSADGKHRCEGTPLQCASELSESKVSTTKAPNVDNPEVQDDWCGAECKTICANGAKCCGPCDGCTEFCAANGGKAPKHAFESE